MASSIDDRELFGLSGPAVKKRKIQSDDPRRLRGADRTQAQKAAQERRKQRSIEEAKEGLRSIGREPKRPIGRPPKAKVQAAPTLDIRLLGGIVELPFNAIAYRLGPKWRLRQEERQALAEATGLCVQTYAPGLLEKSPVIYLGAVLAMIVAERLSIREEGTQPERQKPQAPPAPNLEDAVMHGGVALGPRMG